MFHYKGVCTLIFLLYFSLFRSKNRAFTLNLGLSTSHLTAFTGSGIYTERFRQISVGDDSATGFFVKAVYHIDEGMP